MEMNLSPEKYLPNGWEIKKLKEIGSCVRGLIYSPEDISDKGLLVLRSSNIQDGKIYLEDNVYVNKKIESKFVLREGDILICVRNGSRRLIGKSAIIPSNIPYATHGAFMTVFRSKMSPFIGYLIASNYFYKQVSRDIGATINSINNINLLNFSFPIPSRTEQTKITEILSTFENSIDKVQLEIKKIEDLKTAILDKFLKGNINSKKDDFDARTKKFQNLKVINFDSLIGIISGKGFKAKDYANSGVRLLRIDNVHWGRIKWETIVYLPQMFLKKESKLVLKKGDILLALNRPITQGKLKIAKCSQEDIPSILYQRVGKIYSKNESQITNSFIFYLMQSVLPEFIKNESVGSDQPFINLTSLRSLKLQIPELNEQKKIVNVLESIDACAELKQAKLAKLKFLKSGILNDLLSGQKRVKF